jgi:hypothetical protein
VQQVRGARKRALLWRSSRPGGIVSRACHGRPSFLFLVRVSTPDADDRPGPYAALATRARRTSDGALTIAAAVGVVAVLGLVLWRPVWWTLATPLVAVGAFGVWGTLERERAGRAPTVQHSPAARAVVVGQWVAVVVGTGALLVAAFRILGTLIGTVIS